MRDLNGGAQNKRDLKALNTKREKLKKSQNHILKAKKLFEEAKGMKDEPAPKIDPELMNEAGYYEGMPGVFLDKDGNRRIYEIRQLPNGEIEGLLGCHPVQAIDCVIVLMESNPMIRQMYLGAARKYKRAHRWTLFVSNITAPFRYLRNKFRGKKPKLSTGMIKPVDQATDTPVVDINKK